MAEMDNNSSDHLSFINAEVDSAFTISTVYNQDPSTINQPTFMPEQISEMTLNMVTNTIWNTFLQMNEKYVMVKMNNDK